VKAAIEFLRFLQECKQSNNTVIIEILDCLTDNIFEAYSALANATGGTIILGRQLSKKRKKYWDRKENIQSQYLENTEEAEGEETLQTWEKESTQIISELFCTLNDSKKVNINLLTKESIYVREINGEELYVIQVPKGDKQTVAVFIDSQWQCF
jgi:predicted HTH transcriptional regulator